jgi:type I restriction enzyme R subunit
MAFLTEADTCRRYVLPKLYAAGWNDEQISEQKSFTDGRIVVAGTKVKRRPQKRLDYLLRYRRDFPIAVVEAKTIYAKPGDGLQQAKEYAQILGLKFAYATNGHGIVEHDFLTGQDNDLEAFPSAEDLWSRLSTSEGIVDEKTAERVLAPYYHLSGKSPRYYQEIAINRAVQAVLQGKHRVLLTLATGTGKTVIAFRSATSSGIRDGTAAGSIGDPVSSFSLTAMYLSMIQRTRLLLHSGMHAGRSREKR